MSETAKPASASWPKYALPFDTAINGYRIERVLGSGGFGVTYLARDLLGQPFAIKEYFPRQFSVREDMTVVAASSDDTTLFEECRDRFLREAQALVLLGKRARAEDGIVRVQTYFEAHGTCFMVMDFVEGMSLATVLQTAPGGLAAERVDELLVQLLSSLRAVHQAGLMHRDIKPANIILTETGRPVLIDFGSSRESAGDLNTTYTQIYSGGYAPPEQILGMPQGEYSDIYAVGAVCYQAVGGKVVDALLRQNTTSAGRPDPLPPASKVGAGRYPELLLIAIDAALQVDPVARPKNVDAMLALLRPDAPEDGLTVVMPSRAASPMPQPVAPPVVQTKSRRGLYWASGAGALALAGIGAFVLWKPAPPPAVVLPVAPAKVVDTWDPATPAAAPSAPVAVEAPATASSEAERQLERVPVLERANEAAEALPCSVLTVKRGADGLRIAGFAPEGPELNQLLAKLRNTGNPTDAITRVDRSTCDVITTVAPFVRQAWDSVPRTFSVQPAESEATIGDRYRVNIETALPALIVDVYRNDGTVHHMPHPLHSGTGGRFHAEWVAGGEPGGRLVVAIASETPLDLGTRPAIEPATEYLETLRSRLDTATMAVTADLTTMTVHRR
jgi:predicted Ser/Thr protein kinase